MMGNTDNFVRAAEAFDRLAEKMNHIARRTADQLARNKGYKDAAHMLEDTEKGDE